MSSKRAVEFWEIFPGRTNFYLNGNLQSGPDRSSLYIAVSLIFFPASIFFSMVCPYLIEKYDWGIAVTTISGVLVGCSIVNLVITAFIDPGIIPRTPEYEDPPGKKKPPAYKKIVVNNVKMKVKFCDTCNIYRPPRATHCSICNNCVDRFDHHCPWIGNCIGKRNYRFFLFFVYSVTLNAIYCATFAIIHYILESLEMANISSIDRFANGWKKAPLSLPLAVICLIGFCLLLGLGGFHLYLIATGQTTNEKLKNLYGKGKPNPHTLGCFKNYIFLFCPPHYPRYIQYKKKIGIN